jgi:hypothetical protein
MLSPTVDPENMRKARGKPTPFFTFGQVTTISAPFGSTWLRFAITQIDHPLLDLNALRVSSTNSFGCSKAAKRGWVRRRLSCASPVLATTRKRAECGAQFLDEYGGLLKGREMSAVGGFVPIEESRIDPFAPQSRR